MLRCGARPGRGRCPRAGTTARSARKRIARRAAHPPRAPAPGTVHGAASSAPSRRGHAGTPHRAPRSRSRPPTPKRMTAMLPKNPTQTHTPTSSLRHIGAMALLALSLIRIRRNQRAGADLARARIEPRPERRGRHGQHLGQPARAALPHRQPRARLPADKRRSRLRRHRRRHLRGGRVPGNGRGQRLPQHLRLRDAHRARELRGRDHQVYARRVRARRKHELRRRHHHLQQRNPRRHPGGRRGQYGPLPLVHQEPAILPISRNLDDPKRQRQDHPNEGQRLRVQPRRSQASPSMPRARERTTTASATPSRRPSPSMPRSTSPARRSSSSSSTAARNATRSARRQRTPPR